MLADCQPIVAVTPVRDSLPVKLTVTVSQDFARAQEALFDWICELITYGLKSNDVKWLFAKVHT